MDEIDEEYIGLRCRNHTSRSEFPLCQLLAGWPLPSTWDALSQFKHLSQLVPLRITMALARDGLFDIHVCCQARCV